MREESDIQKEIASRKKIKMNTGLLDKLFPINFQRDGLCMANVLQQKVCVNFKKQDGLKYELCKFQGMGTTCEMENN